MTLSALPSPRATGAIAAQALLDALPCGAIVTDAAGEVVASNGLADEIAPGADIVALLPARTVVPGAPVDVRLPSGLTLTVTSGTTRDGGLRTHLLAVSAPVEPVRASDRRLTIAALGRTRVEDADGAIGGAWLDQRPGQLLRYLVCARHRLVPLDEIAEALWPGAGRRGPGTVRHFIHAIRQQVEPERGRGSRRSFIIAQRGGYRIDTDAVTVDADLFEAAVRRGLAAGTGPDEAVAQLSRALELYRGDFLADEPYADWALAERDRLRSLAGRALEALAGYLEERGEVDEAAALIERLAALEPYDTVVHRRLVELCLARGRQSEAMRRYSVFAKRLERDLGLTPDFSLAELGAGVSARAPVRAVS